MTVTYENQLDLYVNDERLAIELINIVGKLALDKSIELVFFKKQLIDANISQVIQLHDYANEVIQSPITVKDVTELAREVLKLELGVSKVDIGKLTHEWLKQKKSDSSLEISDFLNQEIGFLICKETTTNVTPKDVILFGFGRIGRLVARELIHGRTSGQKLRLRAIVTRSIDAKSLEKRASLLATDSVHGSFPGTVKVDTDTNSLIVNGQRILFIAAKNPAEIDYTRHDIQNALLIDNTGVYRDYTALSAHKAAKGVSKVILTAPGKEIPNIVYGINHRNFDVDQVDIFSAASCTTNAIAPILKVMQDTFKVEAGHIETIHSYTNDQNLLDNMHAKNRRGRSAAVNMVITETGAGKAVVKILPELQDKLTANAVRVPTPNGSLAIIQLNIETATDIDQIKNTLRKAALHGDLVNQIHYAASNELVSNDIIGNNCCSIFDSNATLVSKNGKRMVLHVWYDNEFGYSKQVVRLAKYVAKVKRNVYY